MPFLSSPSDSTVLHDTLPTTFTSHIKTHTRKKRVLNIRGPFLSLSKPYSQSSSKLILLSRSQRLSFSKDSSVSIQGQRLSFPNVSIRNEFVRAANLAISRATTGIDRYETLQQLGHGYSGVVYLVRRKKDGKLFAMKTMKKKMMMFSDATMNRVIMEREALIKATERNSSFIVRLVDAFETDEKLCFVTEFARHGDLANVLKETKGKRLRERVVRRLFSEMILGLEEVHRMGYLYRDFKLENLLLTDTGHVKLANFGLIKKLNLEYMGSDVSSSSESDLSDTINETFRLIGRTKSFVGSRRYMSPEHLSGGPGFTEGYGAPADIWALGVTLYKLLTGKYPFGNNFGPRNTEKVFEAIRGEELEFPEYLSEEVRTLLRGMLMRPQLQRFEIEDIKKCEWMKDVNWENVKDQAERDEMRCDVIQTLVGGDPRCNIQVEEFGASELERDSFNIREGLDCKKVVRGQLDLVGFRYSKSWRDVY